MLPCSFYEQDDSTKSSEENARNYCNQLKIFREQAVMEAKICDLQKIPGVGKNIEEDLLSIGIRTIEDLKGKIPRNCIKWIVYKKDFKKTDASFMYSDVRFIRQSMKNMNRRS